MNPLLVNSWHRIRTVLMKEISDHLRDKRSIILSLLFPLMAPLTVALLLNFVAGANIEGTDGRVRAIGAAVSGRAFAPKLINFLKINQISLVDAPETGKNARRWSQRGFIPLFW